MLPVGSTPDKEHRNVPANHFTRIVIVFALVVLFLVSCHSAPGPARTVQELVRTVERGEIDQAAAFMSQGFVSRQGIDTIKESLRLTALWIKNDGGVKSIEVVKEDSVGDVAEVTIKLTRGAGDYSVVHYRLVREQGKWKIDGISSEPTVGVGAEPVSTDAHYIRSRSSRGSRYCRLCFVRFSRV